MVHSPLLAQFLWKFPMWYKHVFFTRGSVFSSIQTDGCFVQFLEHVIHLGRLHRRDVVLPTGPGVARGLRMFLHFGIECPFNFQMLAFFPPKQRGEHLLPQICSGVDLPVCSTVAGLFARSLFLPLRCGALPPPFTSLHEREREKTTKAQERE